jgi:alpha-L-rhamnosidase
VLAGRIEQTLHATAWDAQTRSWREYLEPSSTGCSYPNFLAVLSGITPTTVTGGVRSALLTGEVGTPFMSAFALRALAACGEPDAAVDRIRRLWGGMLDAGARTFWEDFEPAGERQYAMYGRPFGKSLCHAWGSGPAVLLPEIVLGLRPVARGWPRFEVAPHLGDLRWAGAVVPVTGGADIRVVADRDSVSVTIPAGTTLVRGQQTYPGPDDVRLGQA